MKDESAERLRPSVCGLKPETRAIVLINSQQSGSFGGSPSKLVVVVSFSSPVFLIFKVQQPIIHQSAQN